MINMYIDESGSINPFRTRLKRYFVVGIVIPKNKERLIKCLMIKVIL